MISLAPSTLRKLANYVKMFVKLERDALSAPKLLQIRYLDRLEAGANTILADTGKRRLALRQQSAEQQESGQSK